MSSDLGLAGSSNNEVAMAGSRVLSLDRAMGGWRSVPWTPLRVFLLVKQVKGRMGLIYIGAKMDVRGSQPKPLQRLFWTLFSASAEVPAWHGSGIVGIPPGSSSVQQWNCQERQL